ncbi:hypothetical protein A2V82_08940 [candidate division KSB1 bacterium RBG_16_48_16]|nr:MAG: hypothetical protein A2V82_08940 [candidate division KSB1 bacterium RBG_16_48_16]
MTVNYVQRRFLTLVITLLFSISTQLLAADAGRVENFTLADYKGEKHALSDYKEAKAIVLMFIATRCPVSNAYNERMAALYEDYTQKGVAFVGINSNKTESVDEVKKHAAENGLLFPILKDENNVIADKLEASVTPEIYVLDTNFNVLYHGSIDDSRRPDQVKSNSLKKALDEILASEQVSEKETKAFGCTIKKV